MPSTHSTASLPPRDEVLLATRRYNAMVTRGITSPLAWRSIAIRLWAASHLVTGESIVFVRDRANDAHQRADSFAGTASASRFS